ncbi:lipoprotein [Rhodanobacter sp. C05]|uniref:LPS translocon maturation chaperone LptM n=1 Tax=Rhodanobacter sp. C05 TaxID=1945855 RepID=UPI00098412B9|nr:lipoprotein [Rhodanobacter sp. C05]OOG38978.1 sugar transporter [Rhodanobacter sp. C05]
MHRSFLLLPLCLVVALLAGCGQKGPLVLPPTKPVSASSTAKPRMPAPAASVETQDSDQY